MRWLLLLSDVLDRLLAAVARAGAWLLVLIMGVICFDVVTRKFGFQIPGFGSTRLQELEWHLHAGLFSLWLGYCYVRNAHVRIDVLTAGLAPRRQAWIEFAGCLVFALPYCAVVIWFGYDFAERSFLQNEFSDSPSGLPHRWIIKGVLFAGLVLLGLAVVSVMLRQAAFLLGPSRSREGPLPRASGH